MPRRLFRLGVLVLPGLVLAGVAASPGWGQTGARTTGTSACYFPAAPDCGPGCQPTTCVRVPDVKKVKHTIYACKTEEFCSAACCLHGLFRWCCDCGKVRTKTILLKRVVTEDCPTTKCVPHPCGVPGCGGTVAYPAVPLPAGVGASHPPDPGSVPSSGLPR
ncbi:MAG: hypothetical protein IT429_03510 [Gemmataceae bacterium]|nr:hypothetical protein [Gemmataceae bacterium]